MSPPDEDPPGKRAPRDGLLRMAIDNTSSPEAIREAGLEYFSHFSGLPRIERIEQRGRSIGATFRFVMEDGTVVPVGTIEVLNSRTKLSNVFKVMLGVPITALSPAVWADMSSKLFAAGCVTVDENADTFTDTVRSWLQVHAERMTTDIDGALLRSQPFSEDGLVCVHVNSFTTEIRRRHSASVSEDDVRSALLLLGFEPHCRRYYVDKKRSSRRVYRAPVSVLEDRD